MASALRQEQQAFVSNLEAATDRSINRLLVRLAVLVLVILGLGAAFAYRRSGRRWPSRVDHAANA
jgi:hypothetical protein